MPVYKVDIELHVDGDDVESLWETLDQIRELEGASINSASPYHDNPSDYPEFDDE